MAPTPFSQDPTRVSHVVVLALFSFLALLAVIFRLWARKIQRHAWETNDYLVIVGLIWALALSIFTMYSNIYWDLGGDNTQYGSPEAIGRLVVLQFKVLSLLHDGRLVLAKSLTGAAGWHSPLGSRRHLHSRRGPRSLHSHISDKIFPHDLLRGPQHQRSIRSRYYPGRNSELPANCIQLEPLNTRWLLWRSEIAGSIHWRFQSANGRDCGRAPVTRPMGSANGQGKKIRSERNFWFGHHVCPFSVALFAQLARSCVLTNGQNMHNYSYSNRCD